MFFVHDSSTVANVPLIPLTFISLITYRMTGLLSITESLLLTLSDCSTTDRATVRVDVDDNDVNCDTLDNSCDAVSNIVPESNSNGNENIINDDNDGNQSKRRKSCEVDDDTNRHTVPEILIPPVSTSHEIIPDDCCIDNDGEDFPGNKNNNGICQQSKVVPIMR
jgi:hypothetical protein